MPLIDIWLNSRDTVLEMSIQQIVSIAGGGKLKDNDQSSDELRQFLMQIDSKNLARFAYECLETSFADSGFVLQDIINEAGRRLGLKVSNGIYRGKQDYNNCDGIWRSDEWTFIVEVKTTDAYSISLEKIANYLDSEVVEETKHKSSCLIVVGRQDTATLEDQLRGSRHNWHMRILGVEALFKAIELRESSEDPSLTARIVELFIPQEFTRVDQIISTALDFASDREEIYTPDQELDTYEDEHNVSSNKPFRTVVTDKDKIDTFKVEIAKRISRNFEVNLIRNRSSFEDLNKNLRFAVAVSKVYDRRDKYWYAYHTRQREYLSKASSGFFVLGCLDTAKAFAIPVEKMNNCAQYMLTTTPKGNEAKLYYHVVIRYEDNRHFIYVHPNQSKIDIEEFELI